MELHITEPETGKITIIPEPQITSQRLETFFTQPGINITGICLEAGIAKQYLNRCRKEKSLPGPKVMEKLLPVLNKYGF